ncbi:DUF1540 domain-containing protein [Paraclostridium sordellii]|uniref:DUF1540 domain-containing protein n=1 Tax=Paraclostridium sordellii TaxID=1505 RepID=UPI0005E4FD9E|nr:DUF1540 domain-containing protein [Paeniclostridium sordellii]CEN97183.1 hypothetical protein DUF1540 [[Clostridium] sordellii] [Paeniclostridium sordellii]CEN97939.1 hypothetical protein DUF1540 [[Clostridium] sordellii] [Paeniclostridium sordellii]
MSKINCSVDNCSHNNKEICYANRIDIQGNKATSIEHTACASFLDNSVYSTLTNNTNDNGACSCLCCKVRTCNYNENNLCTLESIKVSPDNKKPNIYSETSCSSFECK